jgi:hypothetical protein
MTSPVDLALMVTPLAAYLYLVALWHAGRRPRVVSGAADVAALGGGLSGLLVFGPVGDWLVHLFFRRPGPIHRLFFVLIGIQVVMRLARRAASRLVIYHIDAGVLDTALEEALMPGQFGRTLCGYEDGTAGLGIRVDYSPRWRTAVVEAFGQGAHALSSTLLPRLRRQLREVASAPSEVPLLLFGLSALTMLVPLVGLLLAEPRSRAALRGLIQHLQGG